MFKVGLVGAGFMGQLHAAAWAETPAQLAAVLDHNAEHVRAIHEQYGATPYDDLDALLAAVDVVDICTPTHTHHALVLRAARAGKHIVCEKPLARTAEQADEMVAACRAAGVKLLVGHVVRFFPEYALAKQIVDGGELGRLGVVRLKRVSSGPTWSKWFFDFEKSGGMILDLMIHDFDYAQWVAGPVESVFVRSVRGQNPSAPTDYALAILRHESGVLSHVEGGWAYPPPLFRTALEIAGENGVIEHPAESSAPLHVYLKEHGTDTGAGVPTSPLLEDPYHAQIKHFYDVLANDTPARIAPEEGAAAVRIALAAIESARTGRRVRLGEV